jgi:hypothetical protein
MCINMLEKKQIKVAYILNIYRNLLSNKHLTKQNETPIREAGGVD